MQSLLSSSGAGKGRGKRRKAAVPRPPPLLLVQDAEAALARLQERVSALLLHSRAPSPPTPTRGPSTLSDWTGAAPLWLKSNLLDGGSTGLSDFYVAELKEFFTPTDSVTVRNTKEVCLFFIVIFQSLIVKGPILYPFYTRCNYWNVSFGFQLQIAIVVYLSVVSDRLF